MDLICGKVDWFNSEKGFGLVILFDGEEIFVHKSKVTGDIKTNDYVLVSKTSYNEIKKRKEAESVKKINSKNLEELLKNISTNNFDEIIKVFKNIGKTELKEYISSRTEEFKTVVDNSQYILVRKWLDSVNNYLDYEYNDIKFNSLLHLYSISNDFYKNRLWFDCYWKCKEIKGDTLLNWLAHSTTKGFINNQSKLQEFIVPTNDFILNSIFSLDFREIDDIFKKINQTQQELILTSALLNIRNRDQPSFFSTEFNLIVKKGNKDGKKSLLEVLNQKWVDYSNKNNISELVKIINFYCDDFSELVDCIFVNSNIKIINELLNLWVNEKLNLVSLLHLDRRLSEDKEYEKILLKITPNHLSDSLKLHIFNVLYSRIKVIDNNTSYNYIIDLTNFCTPTYSRNRSNLEDKIEYVFDREIVLPSLFKKATLKYNYLLRGYFHYSINLYNYLIELGIFLGYNKDTINKLLILFFPNQDFDYFNKGYSKGWSDVFIDTCNNEKFNMLKRLFIEELNICKNRKDKKKKITHTATDFANFTFCSASYTLTRIYDLPQKENFKMFVGEAFHEKKRLLDFVKDYKTNSYNGIGLNISKDFYRIANSTLLDNGHTENPTLYYSKNKKICGIPDYIFKDAYGVNFAVEEKFTFNTKKDISNLYNNHKAQALAYLYGLDSLSLSNIYVIYWYIQKAGDDYTVVDVDIFNIIKTEENKQITLSTFTSLEKLNSNEPIEFSQASLNFRKCINCSLFSFCDYKKGTINKLKID